MFVTSSRWMGAIVVAVLTMSLSGCAAKKDFTPEDFAKVTKGMTEAAATEILGAPTETMSAAGVKRTYYVVGDKYYSVSFTDGKVSEPMVHPNKEDYMAMKVLMEMFSKMPK